MSTLTHFAPRIYKVLKSGHHLVALGVPVAVAAQLWRSSVLAQTMCECELRKITPRDVLLLVAQGRQLIVVKSPIADLQT